MNEIYKKLEEPLRSVRCGLCIIFFALLSACASQTLFQSNFDATPVGQPPAHMQQVGTANVSGPPGSVVVVASPVQTEGPLGTGLASSRSCEHRCVSGQLLTVRGGWQLYL